MRLDSEAVIDGKKISRAVERFAMEKGLVALPFYHDEPIWILHDKEPKKGMVAQLQITAALDDGEQVLFFIPSFYFIDKNALKMAVNRQSCADKIDRLQWKSYQEGTFASSMSRAWQMSVQIRDHSRRPNEGDETFVWTNLSPALRGKYEIGSDQV